MLHPLESLELRYRFLPYQLGSDLSDKPIPRRDAMRKKFGEKRAEIFQSKTRDKLSSVGYQV